MKDFQTPDTLIGCADMIVRQQKEINEQKKQINEQNSRLSRWAHEFEDKMAQVKRRAQDAKDEHMLEVAEQNQRTQELGLQITLQANAKDEAESMLRREQEKAHALRLECDCLRQDLSQQRALANEDDQITRGAGDSLHDLVDTCVTNIIRDFIADLDRALDRVRSGGDSFVRKSNRQFRQDCELRDELRRRTSQERHRESQADAAKPNLAGFNPTHSATVHLQHKLPQSHQKQGSETLKTQTASRRRNSRPKLSTMAACISEANAKDRELAEGVANRI